VIAKAFIFDMDGVLADSTALQLEAWQLFLRQKNLHFSQDSVRKDIFGRPAKEIFRSMRGGNLTDREVEQYIAGREQIYLNLARNDLKPVRGVKEFISKLYSDAIPLAVATSSPRATLSFTLHALDLDSYFRGVTLASEDIKFGKPNPEIYKTACRQLNLAPNKCFVFEDSIAGIRAAKAAGCPVGVPLSTLTLAEAKHEKPDIIFKDFSDEKLGKIPGYE